MVPLRGYLKFTSVQDKRDNFLSIYQMVPLRGSVNPITPRSPCVDLMAQRIPLQMKYTFSTKLEVHFYTGETRQFIAYISNGHPVGSCESNNNTPLMRT